MQQRHPDEITHQTLAQRLSIENALLPLQKIDSALTDFTKLTDLANKKNINIKVIVNTDWETQTGKHKIKDSLKWLQLLKALY